MNADNYGGSVEEYRLAEQSTVNCMMTVPYISEYAGFLFKKAYIESRQASVPAPDSTLPLE